MLLVVRKKWVKEEPVQEVYKVCEECNYMFSTKTNCKCMLNREMRNPLW